MQAIYDFIASNFVVGLCSSLAAALIGVWLRGWRGTPWSGWPKRRFKPQQKGAKDLEYVIKVLGNIQSWLGSNDFYFSKEIGDCLWHAIEYLDIMQRTCIVIYSNTIKEQEWNLRQISRMGKNIAMKALDAIIVETSSHAIEALAKQYLKEIKEQT